MAGEHESGVLSCPDCTRHREAMFAWQMRFWQISSLLIECIGARADQRVPGTASTWAEAYTKITGVKWAEAVERAARLREALAKRREARK